MDMVSNQQMNFTQLLDTFQLFDTNKDGYISFEEFRSACEKLQMPVEETKMKDLFHEQNTLSFDEFCRIVRDHRSQSADAFFQETFRAFDKNSDGFISVKEIQKTMKDLGESLTSKQAKEMLKVADINGDGKLSKEEFRHLFNQLTQFTNSSA